MQGDDKDKTLFLSCDSPATARPGASIHLDCGYYYIYCLISIHLLWWASAIRDYPEV